MPISTNLSFPFDLQLFFSEHASNNLFEAKEKKQEKSPQKIDDSKEKKLNTKKYQNENIRFEREFMNFVWLLYDLFGHGWFKLLLLCFFISFRFILFDVQPNAIIYYIFDIIFMALNIDIYQLYQHIDI